MAQTYYIPEHELLFQDNVAKAVMRKLKEQGAPIGDDFKLMDGWQMTLKHDTDNGIIKYTIFKLGLTSEE